MLRSKVNLRLQIIQENFVNVNVITLEMHLFSNNNCKETCNPLHSHLIQPLLLEQLTHVELKITDSITITLHY